MAYISSPTDSSQSGWHLGVELAYINPWQRRDYFVQNCGACCTNFHFVSNFVQGRGIFCTNFMRVRQWGILGQPISHFSSHSGLAISFIIRWMSPARLAR